MNLKSIFTNIKIVFQNKQYVAVKQKVSSLNSETTINIELSIRRLQKHYNKNNMNI